MVDIEERKQENGNKILNIFISVACILIIVFHTINQLIGDWRGGIYVYVICIIVFLYNISKLVKPKKLSNSILGFVIVLSCIILLLIVGGCIFLYLFNNL